MSFRFRHEITLPVAVRHLAEGDMPLQPQPVVGEGQHPILGQSKARLGHRSCIDSQRLRATAQPVVLQFHGKFLAAHRQHAMQPSCFHKRLLHDGLAGVAHRGHDIQPVAQRPAARGIIPQGTLHARPQITVVRFQRTQSMPVGVQPQRRGTFGHGSLCLHPVLDILREIQSTCFSTFLPRILRMTDKRPCAQGSKVNKLLEIHVIISMVI